MLKKLLLSVLAILVIFEEWLWDILTVVGLWLSLILHLQRLDERLSKASPQEAIIALLLPLVIVTPINVLGLLLLTRGSLVEGILLEVIAKLLGTLLVARVFRLVRPALMTFPWFANIYHTITSILRWAHELIHETALYRLGTTIKRSIKTRMALAIQAFRRL